MFLNGKNCGTVLLFYTDRVWVEQLRFTLLRNIRMRYPFPKWRKSNYRLMHL